MRWIGYYLSISISLLSLVGFGQFSGLRIVSQDSINFQVNLDGFYQSDSINSSFDFVFDSVPQVIGRLILADDSTTINFQANLTKDFLEIYELSRVGNQYLVLPFLKTQFAVDSLQMASISPLQFNDSISFTNGLKPSIVGCSPPSRNVDEVISSIARENFSFRKNELITDALSNNCFYVDQIQSILQTIDYEDQKIKLLELAYNHAYDLNNFVQLKSLFYLEKYQKQFDKFIREKELN